VRLPYSSFSVFPSFLTFPVPQDLSRGISPLSPLFDTTNRRQIVSSVAFSLTAARAKPPFPSRETSSFSFQLFFFSSPCPHVTEFSCFFFSIVRPPRSPLSIAPFIQLFRQWGLCLFPSFFLRVWGRSSSDGPRLDFPIGNAAPSPPPSVEEPLPSVF